MDDDRWEQCSVAVRLWEERMRWMAITVDRKTAMYDKTVEEKEVEVEEEEEIYCVRL